MGQQSYHYEANGQQCGPIELEQLVAMVQSGAFPRDIRVWTEGMQEWTPISSLFPDLMVTSPTPVLLPAPLGNERVPNGKNKSLRTALLIGLGAFFLIIFSIFASKNVIFNSKAENIVKTGHFNSHPEETIGKAVDGFFGDPSWDSGIGDDNDEETRGKSLVNAKGKIKFMNKEVNAHIQFIVNEKDQTFELHAFELNGIPQNQLMIIGLIDKMYEKN